VPLKSLGLVLRFGHKQQEICLNPHTIKTFTVIHTNGLHDVVAQFCSCVQKSTAGKYRQQLLRRRLYPSTHIDPRSAATFDVLNHFHTMTLQGKINTYDYYNGLENLRNNAGIGKVKVCITASHCQSV
jgi:hypothetical protein